jgi:hypothetical protein
MQTNATDGYLHFREKLTAKSAKRRERDFLLFALDFTSEIL